MSPESFGRNNQVGKRLEKAFDVIKREQKLQFFADGKVRVLNLVETGDTEVKAMSIGDAGELEMHARVPLSEPLVAAEYASIDELVGKRKTRKPRKDRSPGANYYNLTPITNPDYLSWKAQAPTSEQIREAALAVSQEPVDESIPETLGMKTVESDCLCTEGGIIFKDFVEDEEVQLRKDGVPDPDCEICGGTGKDPYEVPIPNPAARPKVPEIILKNYVTGEEKLLHIDVAGLVASGELAVSIENFDRVHKGVKRPRLEEDGGVGIKFHLLDYIAEQARQMGIDLENSLAVRQFDDDESIVSVETVLHDTLGVGASWHNRDGEVREHSMDEIKDPLEVVREAQKDVSRCFFDRKLCFKPASPMEETFSRLLAILGGAGYTLGFREAWIGTGMTGPTFYALDQEGFLVGELSCGYEVGEALAGALHKAQEWLSRLSDTGTQTANM